VDVRVEEGEQEWIWMLDSQKDWTGEGRRGGGTFAGSGEGLRGCITGTVKRRGCRMRESDNPYQVRGEKLCGGCDELRGP